MNDLPINWAVIKHPLNWLIIMLMVIIAAIAIQQVGKFISPTASAPQD